MIAIVANDIAEAVIERMHQNEFGSGACVIGEVQAEPKGIVSMTTAFGGKRIVDMLAGEQLPRIC
jgi:hydrogenase expression/formation protein HypE